MKLGVSACTQIAAFLCGDKGTPFPYRTGRELSLFFTGLGHDYRINDFSSRGNLAESALIEIDSKYGVKEGDSLSVEIAEILQELMSPTAFEISNDEEANYDKALRNLNRVLNRMKLQMFCNNGIPIIESSDGVVVSTSSVSIKSSNRLIFTPAVFQVPENPEPHEDLVSVMMPFKSSFDIVFETIQNSCSELQLRSSRVKDIWVQSQIIQDIFELILMSNVVIVDFTDANTNVFYEAGIAHTLGKEVIPIAQSIKHDVPFDLQSHRVIEYQNSREGLELLKLKLTRRLKTILSGHDWSSVGADDVPF
ncbi:hypothetical protein OAG75_00025 [bacterium]|nr:hypothetical protein [bacterium]